MSAQGLFVSESFLSVQGEGVSVGQPAVFLRLQSCNLLCGKGADATWTCDTLAVWQQGSFYEFDSLLAMFESNGFITALNKGAHLVVTGGEPLLQQEALGLFLRVLPSGIFVEIETNGTIFPLESVSQCVSQWNVSPKLLSSGMKKEKRLVASVLTYFSSVECAYFKFVLSQVSEFDEVLREFILPFSLDRKKIFLMPASESRQTLQDLSPDIISLCIKEGIRFSTRLHLSVWDQKTGV